MVVLQRTLIGRACTGPVRFGPPWSSTASAADVGDQEEGVDVREGGRCLNEVVAGISVNGVGARCPTFAAGAWESGGSVSLKAEVNWENEGK